MTPQDERDAHALAAKLEVLTRTLPWTAVRYMAVCDAVEQLAKCVKQEAS